MKSPFRHHRILHAAAIIGLATAGTMLSGCKGQTKSQKEARAYVRAKHNENIAALAAQTAEQDFRVGNLDLALENARKAIVLEPQNPEHYVLHGRILIEQNELRDARSSFLQATSLDPENGDAHYYLGLVHQRWLKDEEAVASYLRAFEIDPASEAYGLAYLETLIALDRFDEADAFLQDTRYEFEHVAAFRVTEGHLQLMQGEPQAAAETFYQAMLLDPDDLSIKESLVHAYIESSDHVRAQYYLDEILKDPTASERRDLRHLKARCLVMTDRLIEARELYIQLSNEERSDPDIWFELGSVAIKIGDHRRAEQAAQTMISMWPQSADGYLLRGMFKREACMFESAVRDFETAAKLRPDSEEAWLYLGMTYEDAEEPLRAQRAYQEALSINPDSRYAQQLLGSLASVETDSP